MRDRSADLSEKPQRNYTDLAGISATKFPTSSGGPRVGPAQGVDSAM